MNAGKLIARIAWIVPVSLLALGIYQGKVYLDLTRTVQTGVRLTAEITRYERSDRKDVTQAEVDLRVPLPDGGVLVHRRLALPYTIAHRVEKDTVVVYVRPGSPQEIVIASIGGTQRRIALSNAAMSAIMFLIAAVGVFAWNRYQKPLSEPSA